MIPPPSWGMMPVRRRWPGRGWSDRRSTFASSGSPSSSGTSAAVDDLSLDIAEGEFFSMLGPSGCGKTTTLRMIGGFEEPTLGTVYLGGRDVTDLPPYKRDVNTVFQSYALFPHLDVFENVAFGLRRKKVAKDEIETPGEGGAGARRPGRVRDAASPAQMSGGQQQRVALARALVNRPKVLLLDEPLGALDLKLRKQMQLELKRIQQEVGITFIYVTHDQEEAMTMSDRLAVMRHGKIEQIGAPEEVYESPATEFVAGFLGASNLLDGQHRAATNGDDARSVSTTGGSIVPSPTERCPPTRSTSRAGRRCGRRRSRSRRRRATRPTGRNSVTGLLRMSTYIGVSHQYKVEGPGGDDSRSTCRTSARDRAAAPGEQGPADVAPGAHVRGRAVGPRAQDRGGRGNDRASPIDPSLLRGLTAVAVSAPATCSGTRAWARGALGLSSILAACGVKGVATGGRRRRSEAGRRRGGPRRGGPADAAPHAQLRQLAVLHRHRARTGTHPVAG